MSVPPFVPAKVPARSASGNPGRAARPPRYLTGDPSGWRFQIRLSTQFFGGGKASFRIAGGGPIVRAQIGPRSRAEARALAQQLAALCQMICAAAADIRNLTPMSSQPLDPNETALVQQVINACEGAIKQAIAQPSRAIGLAQGFGDALQWLQLIQSEVAKGSAGAPAITGNADALVRSKLGDVLRVASCPDDALAALAAVSDVAPPSAPSGPRPRASAAEQTPSRHSSLPPFSEISQAYIDMRIERDGEDHADIPILRHRRQVFIDVIGDRAPDQYFPSHLQTFVNRIQFLPANVTKRADMQGKPTLEILEENKTFALKPMALKTVKDGYVANVRTMMRHGMQDHHYRDPFAGVKLTYPQTLVPPKPREGISLDVTNEIFRAGVASGLLDEAMLPLLGKLTARRLGLLTFLRGEDIRQKDGVWIAQTDGIVEINDDQTGEKAWRRVPIKTAESMTFYVLHRYLDEIGFIAWMCERKGFIFEAAHEHPNPTKYMSKTMQNHMRRCGAKGGEVFHSLRGDAIDEMRDADVEGRARRLQSGHELGDVHDGYGFRALTAKQCQYLANLPLQEGIKWTVFKGLDFDAMAKRRRGRGRRPKLEG